MSRDWGEAGLCREDLPLACGLDLAIQNTRRSHMSDELDYAQAGDGEQDDNTTVPLNAKVSYVSCGAQSVVLVSNTIFARDVYLPDWLSTCGCRSSASASYYL